MNNTVIKDNVIVFSRYGEVVRLTACYNISIRFDEFIAFVRKGAVVLDCFD